MGMFDYLRCEYPLPAPNAQDLEYQTKDTFAQWMDRYVIRADGSLWHEAYDIEDRSDSNAKGLYKFIGCMTRVNERWERSGMTGEVRFYDYDIDGAALVFSAYFRAGMLQQVNLIADERQRSGVREGGE